QGESAEARKRLRPLIPEPLSPPTRDENGPNAHTVTTRLVRSLRLCRCWRLRRRLRRRPGGRGPLRACALGEHTLEPGDGVVLGQVLRVHELRREDLLRLHVHLLLAGRESLLAVAQRQVP